MTGTDDLGGGDSEGECARAIEDVLEPLRGAGRAPLLAKGGRLDELDGFGHSKALADEFCEGHTVREAFCGDQDPKQILRGHQGLGGARRSPFRGPNDG